MPTDIRDMSALLLRCDTFSLTLFGLGDTYCQRIIRLVPFFGGLSTYILGPSFALDSDEGETTMTMFTYDLFWSPEGRCIATVYASTMYAAIRKAPFPYRRYLGEIYAVQID